MHERLKERCVILYVFEYIEQKHEIKGFAFGEFSKDSDPLGLGS